MPLSLIEMENLDSAWDEEKEGCLPIPPLYDGAFSPYHPTTLALFQVSYFLKFLLIDFLKILLS